MSRGKTAIFKQILYSPYEIGLGVTQRNPLKHPRRQQSLMLRNSLNPLKHRCFKEFSEITWHAPAVLQRRLVRTR